MHKDDRKPFGTGWKNEPKVSDLKADFDNSKSNHDAQVAKINAWLDNLNVKSQPAILEGASNPFYSETKKKVKKSRSTIKPKLIRKQAEWRYTSLSEPFLNTPDIFNVDPVTHEDLDGARQNELLLNNQFNTRIDKVNFIDEYVRTCVNEGTVVVRVGWNFQQVEEDVEYPVYDIFPITKNDKEFEYLTDAMEQDPSLYDEITVRCIERSQNTGIPHWFTQTGVEVEKETVTKANHPTVEVCEYKNVHIDPSCKGDLDKANFIVTTFETSKDELLKSGLYDEAKVKEIQVPTKSVLSTADHESEYAESGFDFEDDARRKLVAYEYWGFWDIHDNGKTVPIVATWVDNVLIRLEENPYPDQKLPFVVVPYLPVKKSLYGEPDGELLEDNQNVLGAVTRGMIDVMARSANGQIGMRKDALDVVNKRKYDKGMDYEFNPGVDPRQAVIEHKYPELPNSAFQMVMHQNNEAESLSGIKAFNEGISGQGLGDTAAAANGALGAAARREMGILRRLADGMKKIGRKIIAMNQDFLSEEEIVRVTNDKFATIRRDDLEGNYDLRLTISTAEADEQKAKELAFMLQTTGQEFGIEMYKLILAEIADLRKMPHLAEQIRNFEPPTDPFADQKAQIALEREMLENEKMKAETAKLYAEARKAQSDSTNKDADTDRKNLDYIQEESGVNQERELEKQKAQSQGNMELEVLKSRLAPKKDEESATPNTL